MSNPLQAAPSAYPSLQDHIHTSYLVSLSTPQFWVADDMTSSLPHHCEMSDTHNAAAGGVRQCLTCCLYREVPSRRGLVTPLSPPTFQSSLIQSISHKQEAPMSMIQSPTSSCEIISRLKKKKPGHTRRTFILARALSMTSMRRPWSAPSTCAPAPVVISATPSLQLVS